MVSTRARACACAYACVCVFVPECVCTLSVSYLQPTFQTHSSCPGFDTFPDSELHESGTSIWNTGALDLVLSGRHRTFYRIRKQLINVPSDALLVSLIA